MPIDPYFTSRFALVEDIASYEEAHADPDKERRLQEFEAQADPWHLPAQVTVTDSAVPGPHGDVPIRVYAADASPGAGRPGVLWMHGGGFVGGDLDMPEAHTVSAELAARTGATVVSVDYRLAVGGVRYPVPLDDTVAAWSWLADHRAELDITGPLVIGGASAGAALAAGAALRLRDEQGVQPAAVLLAYPGPHFPLPPVPADLYEEMRGMPALVRLAYPAVLALQKNYTGHLHAMPAYAAPGNATLTGLPPVSVIVSEYDDLRSSGELFVAQLDEAGTPVRAHLAAGMLHGHLNRVPGPTLPEVARSLDFFADAIRAASGTPIGTE